MRHSQDKGGKRGMLEAAAKRAEKSKKKRERELALYGLSKFGTCLRCGGCGDPEHCDPCDESCFPPEEDE